MEQDWAPKRNIELERMR